MIDLGLEPEPLAFRVRPQADECFDSWVDRLAGAHDTDRAGLLRHLGLDPALARIDLACGRGGLGAIKTGEQGEEPVRHRHAHHFIVDGAQLRADRLLHHVIASRRRSAFVSPGFLACGESVYDSRWLVLIHVGGFLQTKCSGVRVESVPERSLTRAGEGMIRGNHQIFNIRDMVIDLIRFSPMA